MKLEDYFIFQLRLLLNPAIYFFVPVSLCTILIRKTLPAIGNLISIFIPGI